MDPTIQNLVHLGLREYEAKIYVALVGLGEANVRRIHEVSGVPRPRVYDVLNTLAEKGFIDIRQGSPSMYRAVEPEVVVSYLKRDLDTAAEESVKALEALSVDAHQNAAPIWYVHSDWTIQRNLEMLVEGVTRELIVLCFNEETLKKFQRPIQSVAANRSVKVLFPKGYTGAVVHPEGITFYEPGTPGTSFGAKVVEEVLSVPISREGAVFNLECIFIADDQQSMLIYNQNGSRMAVIITLPFITTVQSRLFTRMLEHAHEVHSEA